MTKLDPKSSMAAYFACELRRLREERGLGQEQLGKELYTSRAKIGHYETMTRRPGLDFARQADAFFGTGEHLQTIWHHAKNENLPDWRRRLLCNEALATQIRAFQPIVVPALLQTESYARAMLSAGEHTDLDAVVDARIARQAVLTREDPPSPLLWVVIDEAVVRRPVGGPMVMKEQCERLLDAMESPRITIQVVPLKVGAYLGVDGGFVIFDVDDGDMASADDIISNRLIEDLEEIKKLRVWYDRIRAKALSEDDSRMLIAETMESISADSVAEEQPKHQRHAGPVC